MVNLWPDATVTLTETYFTEPGWAGGLDCHFTTMDDNHSFELTIPDGIGGEEWMGQVKLTTDIQLDHTHSYEFSCKVVATADAQFTLKLTNNPESDDKVSFYDNGLAMKNGTATVKKVDVHPAADAEATFLIFDFGRVPAGTKVAVSDIVLQEYMK